MEHSVKLELPVTHKSTCAGKLCVSRITKVEPILHDWSTTVGAAAAVIASVWIEQRTEPRKKGKRGEESMYLVPQLPPRGRKNSRIGESPRRASGYLVGPLGLAFCTGRLK
ncbi:hypothetical protein KQX54_007706 [Cotesia glomerata]|uniref:Uncharacterized protein n=1 Tax=Cotesia glomerata TaxID=32391 RepID=A0AAV7J651_COTGL|nr:hypothetical protein KQX54_007706 [Cotesia glomerata]